VSETVSTRRTDLNRRFKEVWKHIDSDEVANLALEMVQIPSSTGDESSISAFYAKTLDRLGLEVQLDYIEEGRPNVFARLRGSGGGRSLLLHGHLDTVPIGKCIPPKIEKGRVYGRGSCDMKGSIAAMALAAKGLHESGVRLEGDLILAGTVDHETPQGMGKGVRALVKKMKMDGTKVDGAINTEGPFDTIKVAQGGCAMFTITLTRKGGTLYSATSPFSANPILWVSEIIAHLARIDKALGRKKPHPLMSQRPTVQVGIIRGGDFVFCVPDVVQLEGAIRWDPGEDFQQVSKRLGQSLSELEKRLRTKYHPKIRLDLRMRVDREECEVPHDSRIVLSMRRVLKSITGKQYKLTGSRYVTDLSVLQKEAGIPAVEFGPFLPDDMTAHTDHESVKITHLHTLSRIYASVALEFCSEPNM
jgi:acetylornithine deacetylase/succinyl-diaminopimelate desuccinylase-like protein